ncbi:aromatic ring-hydroxylating dioxygenase subunit alpha [filamentous cyanobacterium LEGE 11480]|uniref:Aromatic ring-hydroxylating dioxygenase subunit alpha n=1 Tax=Romeriopsis navalis LEGE 11480 TaxID=2777977 RepID=A0A928VL74_9CYAN|nr:aromatic ring-hydroxylating dioxygenase subunit alpha [Romeriopsis navalis]MBE9029682.1 aromatic ring-hydroxylating dioxygenase subunit alpha [Romeriopsis navalis LEGE 11480]
MNLAQSQPAQPQQNQLQHPANPAEPQASTFNHPDRFIQGWYWVMPSRPLKCGQVQPVTILGRDLAVYRTAAGQVAIVDAYCPHMGAHLAEGCVDDEGLRCFFHNWRFDSQGVCTDIPYLGHALPIRITTWPVVEHYGLIWVWTGDAPPPPPPFVPELENVVWDVALGKPFVHNCHPNVLMVNAIDAHHFNTVHNFPIEIVFKNEVVNESAIMFSNTTRGGDESWLVRLIQPFYQHEGTYSMCYSYGSTGTVTLGPDFLHFYIVFALRLGPDGTTEGQPIFVTQRRSGVSGWLFNRVVLWLTQQVGNYFAKGDTKIFQTIKFDLKTPLKADQSILQFMHHVEGQQALQYGSWEAVTA